MFRNRAKAEKMSSEEKTKVLSQNNKSGHTNTHTYTNVCIHAHIIMRKEYKNKKERTG